MGNPKIQTEIERAEEELRLGILSSDVTILDKLISSKLIFTNHFGMVITKEQDLLMHKSGDLKISEITLSEMVVEELGRFGVVSVKASIESVFQRAPSSTKFRFTRIWGKECGTWVVVIGHSCIVA